MKELERYQEIERTIITSYRKRIWSKFTKAITDFEMIKDGDKIAVCISGGKDSMLLAKCFQELKRHGKQNFEVVYLCMDPGYNEINRQRIVSNSKILNIPINLFETDIFDRVAKIDEHPCYLCARMRRGHLYKYAQSLGCNKIALGHHFDDVVETILMGMLYGAQIQTMMPRIKSKNFDGMELIRPMYYIREKDIISWRNYNKLEFLQCACRFTEQNAQLDGTGTSKRQEVKNLIKEMKKVNPQVDINIFRSVERVNLNTIIGYYDEDEEHNFLEKFH